MTIAVVVTIAVTRAKITGARATARTIEATATKTATIIETIAANETGAASEQQ